MGDYSSCCVANRCLVMCISHWSAYGHFHRGIQSPLQMVFCSMCPTVSPDPQPPQSSSCGTTVFDAPLSHPVTQGLMDLRCELGDAIRELQQSFGAALEALTLSLSICCLVQSSPTEFDQPVPLLYSSLTHA